MSKNQFKVGQAVAYKAPNGDSISAIITKVDHDGLYVSWFPRLGVTASAFVRASDFDTALLPFGKSLFLTL